VFHTQCREPRLRSSLYDRETLGTRRAKETPEENANKMREIFRSYGEIPRPGQTLQSEEEAMDASGGRRRVDQGTPPIQSDRMIRLETGHDV